MENFVPRIKSLLTERNHGVLLTGITLMIELCQVDPGVVSTFRKVLEREGRGRRYIESTNRHISTYTACSEFSAHTQKPYEWLCSRTRRPRDCRSFPSS